MTTKPKATKTAHPAKGVKGSEKKTKVIDRQERNTVTEGLGKTYRERLLTLGSVLVMADKLGVQPITLERRCKGVTAVTTEAMLALEHLEQSAAE
jgi:hypothetical protein